MVKFEITTFDKFCKKLASSSKIAKEAETFSWRASRMDVSVVTPRRSLAKAMELHPEEKLSWTLWNTLQAFSSTQKGCLTRCFTHFKLTYIWWVFLCCFFFFFPLSSLKSHALLTEAFHFGLFIFGGGKMKEQQAKISERVTVSHKSLL